MMHRVEQEHPGEIALRRLHDDLTPGLKLRELPFPRLVVDGLELRCDRLVRLSVELDGLINVVELDLHAVIDVAPVEQFDDILLVPDEMSHQLTRRASLGLRPPIELVGRHRPEDLFEERAFR